MTRHVMPRSERKIRQAVNHISASGVRLAPVATFALVLALSAVAIDSSTYRALGMLVFGWLGLKMFLAALPARVPHGPTPNLRVGVVITVYNETPGSLLRCLETIASQTYRPHRVVVVDDGSADPAAADLAEQFASRAPFPILVIRHPVNRGKREGLRSGFNVLTDVDVFFCVDSDTELAADSIRQGVRAFSDPRVVAATGAVLARNADANLLTIVEGGRYASAFYGERRALSRLGSVLCVSGAVAFWRAQNVRAVLDEFASQTVFGKTTSVGDDRHLTNLLLPMGSVVFVPSAIAYTDVPERLSHYARQQARWGRSFWLESLWLLARWNVFTWYWWLALGDLVLGAVVASNYVWAVLDFAAGGGLDLAPYLALTIAWAYARNAYVFGAGLPWPLALRMYAASGVNTLLALGLITPLRIWSLLTLHWTTWGTRTAVEIGEGS